jgi:hypothetical protein
MTATLSKQDAPLRYDDLPREDLDALARRLVAKGYTVAIAGPVRRYTDREEWDDYAVEFHAGETQGTFSVNSGNYLAMVAQTGIAFTFQVSADSTNGTDGTFVPLRATPGGAALSFTVAAAGAYQVDPVNFMAWKWVKVVSGSAEGADRVIALIVRPIA